ncbi:MAG: enoyl-CoA hydratase/isomerase family protein [Candidatus Marinimicrobia bacterium]|jgi:enoyl-CoA hydratase/carnithine racemase|nr:enoyl-CoA hydratase/isomerase family protein [Candidatus Neomarinimicrobiota bacterium]|tara:strand:+ start:3076 stop:3819 length:744 start_codon:yes stop_codon:yes gene_type:complete
MNITIENDIKIINMGEKGPNLLSVSRAKELIAELNYDECKAVILMGNEKVFSAGLNLKDLMGAKDPKEVSLIFGTLGELLKSFREFPGPVISIVGGHAIAGGCLIALASDYRYGMFGMHRMGLNEMAIGIDLPPDMLSIISHSISRENLFEVATQCKMYSPKQAYKKGLINEYIGNPFLGKKRATSEALKRAKKLAGFYINAGEPFVRLKQSLMHDTEFDYEILINNWFSPETQAKIKKVMSTLAKK